MTSTNEYELLRAAHIILNMRMCVVITHTKRRDQSMNDFHIKIIKKYLLAGAGWIIQYDDVITKNNKNKI
jgi:hypothetical protein